MYYYCVTNGEHKILLGLNKVLPQYVKNATEYYFEFMDIDSEWSVEEIEIIRIKVHFTEEPEIVYDSKYQGCKLHCKKEGIIQIHSDDLTEVINITDKIVYFISSDKEITVKGYSNNEMLNEIIRLLRVCFEILLEEKGFVKIHMGVINVGKTAYGIVGCPNSGKTTFILELLRSKYLGFICSNDKVYIDENLNCYGVCQRIGIRKEACEEYIGNSGLCCEINEKFYLWPNELVKAFDNRIKCKARINSIICPSFCLYGKLKVSLVDENKKEEIYEECVGMFTDDANMERMKQEIVSKWKITKQENIERIKKELVNLQWVKISGDFRKIKSITLERIIRLMKNT